MAKTEAKTKIQEEIERGAELSVMDLVQSIVEHAVKMRSSDVHLDPEDDGLQVRLRIDGVLLDESKIPKQFATGVVARIKVLSGLRTDEHQSAQDGRFRVIIDDSPVDVRVSIIPTYYGEDVVLRLLSDTAEEFNLDNIGFSKVDYEKITRAIKKPYGMILATGPTGSGKTTTLYSILKTLNQRDTSIITIEDPTEYSIKGINQIGVNSRTGLTFANGLRAVLRQDPDVIMVGEIRDHETAGIAVNTALTGHLLLSTIHTNDAATTLPRLLDMKIEPYLIASTVNLAIGQRLVRKICEECKVQKKITALERQSIADTLPPGAIGEKTLFYYGKGCDACVGTGYRGRIAIYEVLELDQDVRDAILAKAPASEIKSIAVKNGMTTMLQDGIEKAKLGITTLEEVLRIFHE